MRKIELSPTGIVINSRKDDERIPTEIVIFETHGKYQLDVAHPGETTTHDIFDHLWEALDSLTGIVKTYEKEID